MSRDYYEILGLSSDASDSDIKRAYKRLAREYHPDNKATGDESKFKEIGEAYATLSDSQKRASYNRLGHQNYTSGGANAYGGGFADGDIFDEVEKMFDVFFGGGEPRAGRRSANKYRGADLQSSVKIDLMEAAFGSKKTIKIHREKACQTCHGTGASPEHPPEKCPTCHGQGQVRQSTQSFLGTITQVVTCPSCKGTGQIIKHVCPTCNGRKFNKSKEELELEIPQGIEDGNVLIWQGKGNEGLNGGPAGDLHILVKVKEHPDFQRQGLNIFQETPVSLWQAIVGDELEIETIHGSQTLKIQSGIQHGAILKLSSQGIKLKDGRSGDHLVKVNVSIPEAKKLPKELLEMIKEQLEKNPPKNTKEKNPFSKLFKKEGNTKDKD